MRLRAQHYREKQGWREGCLDRDLVDQSARERLGKKEKGREAGTGPRGGAGTCSLEGGEGNRRETEEIRAGRPRAGDGAAEGAKN